MVPPLADWRRRLRGVPLFHRIAIGNTLIIVLGAVGGTLITRSLARQAADWDLIAVFAVVGVSLSLAVNFLILRSALRPLHELQRLIRRLQTGEAAVDFGSLPNPDPAISELAATLERLLEELEGRNRQLRALSERTLTVQEQERREIARSLHDDTSQALSMLMIHLDRIDERLPSGQKVLHRQLAEARQLAEGAVTELRRIVSGLRPAVLDDLGLVAAIRWYARNQLEPAGIRPVIQAPARLKAASPVVTTALFRIAQEAINNIVRHAAATQATIQLGASDGRIVLRVSDDGRGFDPSAGGDQALPVERLGLLGMRERTELLGGRFQLESAPGGGTRLEVSLPADAPGGVHAQDPHPAGG